MATPAIWWRSVELHCGNVTFGSEGLTLLKYTVALPRLALRFFATATRKYQYPKLGNLPQISAIAIPRPTKFHIQD
jgi:hypothetical protein